MADAQRCISAPALPVPALPAGLSFSSPGISVEFNPEFCCQISAVAGFGISPSPPIAIPAIIFSVLSAVLKALMNLINSFIALLAIPCPRL